MYPLKRKSDAFGAFQKYKAYAETQTGRRIQATRDDKGGEYMPAAWNEFCATHGIQRQHTVRNEPHQNGVAERANRTIIEAVTAMLNEAKLPASFWWDAVAAFTHVRNRSPTSSNVNSVTPFERWSKSKPDISHLRVFGCTAYVNLQKDQRKQLQPHYVKCTFLGYHPEYKAWLFWNPVTQKELISNSAVFDEMSFTGTSKTPVHFTLPDDDPEQGGDYYGDNDDNDLPPHPPEQPEQPPADSDDQSDNDNASMPDVPEVPDTPPAPVPAPAPASPPPSPPRAPPKGVKRSRSPSDRSPPPEKRYAKSQPQLRSRPFVNDWDQRVNPLMHYPGRRLPHPWQPPQPPIQFNPVEHPKPESDSDMSSIIESPTSDDDPIDVIMDDYESEEEELLADTLECYLTFEEAYEFMIKHTHTALNANSAEPYQWKDIKGRPDAHLWEQAAADEFMSLIENGTFEPVKLPEGRKAIGNRWVFKLKKKADGSIERYKARLVAKGFSQRPGLEFTQVFASTAKWAALRAILALAALEDLELYSLDISTAFLNGEMDHDVYMQQPEGFKEHFGRGYVLKLMKSLYGLKQAGRQWHKKLDSVLTDMSFSLVRCNNSIWVYRKDDVRIIIPVYVDDMTIACKHKANFEFVRDELAKHFKLHDLGATSFLLGIHIERDRQLRSISLSQRQYIIDVLERFQLGSISSVSTPIAEGAKLSKSMSPKTQEELTQMKDKPYAQLLGALMYLASATRPDISYAVSVLARFMANPGQAHWTALKHLCRYLQGTKDYKLTYAPDPSSTELFTTYSDADHGGNVDNGRSTSGLIVKMGTGAISWGSRLQSMVTLSTTEAEYISATEAGQEILWLRNLFTEFGFTFTSPSKLFMDNQSAIAVANNPEHHGRMKHLDLRHYWLRGVVKKRKIEVLYISTKDMPADIMTKALGRVKVQDMCSKLGLRT